MGTHTQICRHTEQTKQQYILTKPCITGHFFFKVNEFIDAQVTALIDCVVIVCHSYYNHGKEHRARSMYAKTLPTPDLLK